MSSDNRLFETNTAIGRIGFVINIIVLFIVAYATVMICNNYVIPNLINAKNAGIVKGAFYFFYIIYTVTFFALIDRRVLDISGSRDSELYNAFSIIFKIDILSIFLIYLLSFYKVKLGYISIYYNDIVQWLLYFLLFMLAVIAVIKGKITK